MPAARAPAAGSWVCVVPVKGSARAKSRLGELPEDFPARQQLAQAFALDTVAALLAASPVEGVLVVTADPATGTALAALGAQIVPEPPAALPGLSGRSDSLNLAISAGIRVANVRYPHSNVAVFTGDLPALTVGDVESALSAAAACDLAMVADEEGTGTTVLLARAGLPLLPRFGLGSRAAHEAAGHIPLDLPTHSLIRRDVDTVDDLAAVLRRGVGPHTSALIARGQPDRFR
ncbi:2-phospho-L-lactate guanylyltransferase [Cryobacterium sp. PH29-G1]|uniref:2-phospho-L-lactate guanylyltransferase n=1 Tax=Cryobacterium sp. PH29-G1 TaxID=3046211 RepID=UPI0024BBB4EB|nr:2-phospho-L-lactate guanylyltransferase [Cryobacterium sp. PH29-G1]MDJ0350288.1 2-phospho-L-lactate guanylyltransferase [Cryobacterium sp. PH29-G1]